VFHPIPRTIAALGIVAVLLECGSGFQADATLKLLIRSVTRIGKNCWLTMLTVKPSDFGPNATWIRNRRMVDVDSLNALSAFMHAAEMRSFTEAGKHLNLSSSAIGKAVARLEERHGVRLFNRNTRTITLTQEGQLFLDSCKTIFSEIEKLEGEFASAKDAPTGKLRVKLPLLATFMTPCLGRFMRAYPDLDLEIDYTDHSAEIIDGGYDIAVLTGEAPDSRLISRTIGTYHLIVVGSPSYLAQSGVPETVEDLASHSCFYRKCLATGKIERWPVARSSGDTGMVPSKGVASSFDPLIVLAELGVGLVCVPDFLVRRQLEAGSLVALLSKQVGQTETIRAVWPSNRYAAPKLRAFVDFLSRNLLTRDSGDDFSYAREPKPCANRIRRNAQPLAGTRPTASYRMA